MTGLWDQIVFYTSVSPDEARDAVPELARIDLISIILTALIILIALAALLGYSHVTRRAKDVAKQQAREEAKEEARRFLGEEGSSLVAEHLKDEQVVARLHRQFRNLGLDEVDSAGEVDSDPSWRPEND